MFSSNCFAFLLLAVLATPASVLCQGTNTSCPQSGRLSAKLLALATELSSIDGDITCSLDIIAQQCPCLDASSDCFETRVTSFQTALQDLMADVANVTADAPVDCPERTGAVFVASCDEPDVAVVDPNGVIQNDFTLGENVTRLSVFPDGATSGFEYLKNNPFQVRCRAQDGSETVLGDTTDTLLTAGPVGTGIAYNPATDQDYVAISFNGDASRNGIYSFNRTTTDINKVIDITGPTGQIQIFNGVVYMSLGSNILALSAAGPPVIEVFFVVQIASFVVLDVGRFAFCEEATGSVYVVFPATFSFRQIRQPSLSNQCGSIGVNPCNSLLYVVNQNDANIAIYNTTSFTSEGTLAYSTSPSACPSLGVDPTFCCA
ncbi:uncharacterized protein LOC124125580 [Haliotis rufescens]|uniref:uncharacterized protein LOC124125580 n=1 Tax=Haliotis rufescens TaxID=6454 RepID=UPI00201F1C15|nr:uncharacterized protein LOC124125580 [Haliotis rufescens]